MYGSGQGVRVFISQMGMVSACNLVKVPRLDSFLEQPQLSHSLDSSRDWFWRVFFFALNKAPSLAACVKLLRPLATDVPNIIKHCRVLQVILQAILYAHPEIYMLPYLYAVFVVLCSTWNKDCDCDQRDCRRLFDQSDC